MAVEIILQIRRRTQLSTPTLIPTMIIFGIITPLLALASSVVAITCQQQQQADGRKPYKCVNPLVGCPQDYRSVYYDRGCPNPWWSPPWKCCV